MLVVAIPHHHYLASWNYLHQCRLKLDSTVPNIRGTFRLYGEPGFSRVFARFTARKHGELITYF
jgi:hypothetical protein